MPTALITGAGRGIGLELARQLAAAGWAVVATARTPESATELGELRGVEIAQLDVTDAASVDACAAQLAGVQLDLLVNNAGIWDSGGPASTGPLAAIEADAVLEVLRTNAVGALLVTRAFASRLRRGAVVANLSSGLGSLGRDVPRRNYGYAVSKSALNMVTRCTATELDDCIVVSLDPGWVRTALGGPDARITPEQAVAGIIRVVRSLTPEMNGAWLNRHGEVVPW